MSFKPSPLMSTRSMPCIWLMRRAADFRSGFGGKITCCRQSILPVGVANLLVPDQAVLVAVPSRDHVGQAVAVDVVDEHLGGLLRRTGRDGISRARRASATAGCSHQPWLLDQIDPAVAVDVAGADAVGELRRIVLVLRRDGVKHPKLDRAWPGRRWRSPMAAFSRRWCCRSDSGGRPSPLMSTISGDSLPTSFRRQVPPPVAVFRGSLRGRDFHTNRPRRRESRSRGCRASRRR